LNLGSQPGVAGVMPQWSDHATHDEKVLQLFDDFGGRRSGHRRGMELDAWVTACRRLNIGFATATVGELFERADVDGDGAVSLVEFQRFGELYPTLVDCLYYRAKDAATEQQCRASLEDAKCHLGDLRTALQGARDEHKQAQDNTDAADEALQRASAAVAEAQNVEQALQRRVEEAKRETERAKADVRDRTSEIQSIKDTERAEALAAQDVQRKLDTAVRKMQAQEGELRRAEERMREIERLLEEQQYDVQQQRQQVELYRQEVQVVRREEHDASCAVANVRGECRMLAEAVVAAEEEVSRRQDAERAAGGQLREAAGEVSRRVADRDEQHRGVAICREREVAKRGTEEQAARAVDDQERRVDAMHQECSEFVARRRAVDDEEKPLLEKEVRLRAQRESLEKQEAKLRDDFHLFSGRGKSGDGARSSLARSLSPVRDIVSHATAAASAVRAGGMLRNSVGGSGKGSITRYMPHEVSPLREEHSSTSAGGSRRPISPGSGVHLGVRAAVSPFRTSWERRSASSAERT